MSKIIARWEEDCGPGWPYDPVMRATIIVQDGDRYYLRAETNAASVTWLSREKVLAIMRAKDIL